MFVADLAGASHGALDGDGGQAEAGPQADLAQRLADELGRRRHLDDGEVARELDVVEDVRHDQAVRDPHRHLALREDHARDAELLENASVERRHRLGDDVLDAELLDQRDDQQARLDVLADRDDRDVDVLDAGGAQRPLVGGVELARRATPGRPGRRTLSSSPSMPITSCPSCASVVAIAEPNRPSPITANVRLAMVLSSSDQDLAFGIPELRLGRRPRCATAIASVSGPTRPMNIIAIDQQLADRA